MRLAPFCIAGYLQASAAGFVSGLCDTRRRSSRIPPGRSRITATIRTPIIKKRTLGSASGPGRNCVPVQIPQTMNAPSTAPRLLPEPPTISMAHITKVASSGSKVRGSDEPEVMSEQRPAYPHDYRPQDERLELETENVFAAGLGRYLVLPHRPQHPAPRRLHHPLHRDEQDGQRGQHHNQIQIVVVFRRYLVSQELRDAVQPLRAVGRPLLVQEEEPYRFGDAQRRNGEVVVPQPQRDVADNQGDYPAYYRCGHEAQEGTTGQSQGPGTPAQPSRRRT